MYFEWRLALVVVEPLYVVPENIEDLLLPRALEEAKGFDLRAVLNAVMNRTWIVWHDNKLVLIISFVEMGSVLCRATELWLLTGKGAQGLSASAWKTLYRAFKAEASNHHNLRARVPDDFEAGKKFARLFGLTPSYKLDGYQFYEVKQ